MIQPCPKCKRNYDKFKEQYCKDCYELQILKGQCINVAVNALSTQDLNPEHESYAPRLFSLAKIIFEESKKQKFTEW